MTLIVSADAVDNIRYVVYFNRTMGDTRTVINEAELLGAISEHLRPDYRLVVLPSTKEYKSIPELHTVWQQYARIVNRAAVMIGAHGTFLFFVITLLCRICVLLSWRVGLLDS